MGGHHLADSDEEPRAGAARLFLPVRASDGLGRQGTSYPGIAAPPARHPTGSPRRSPPPPTPPAASAPPPPTAGTPPTPPRRTPPPPCPKRTGERSVGEGCVERLARVARNEAKRARGDGGGWWS
jgi:hypothetical protein